MIRVFYYELPDIMQEYSIVVKDMYEFYEALPPSSRPTKVNGSVNVEWDGQKLEWVETE